jgi:hypothetical protein
MTKAMIETRRRAEQARIKMQRLQVVLSRLESGDDTGNWGVTGSAAHIDNTLGELLKGFEAFENGRG